MEYAILATEGADDQAILCSLLKFMKFRAVRESVAGLDSFWQNLLPRFPKAGSFHGYKNLLWPYFFVSPDYSLAIYQGRGDNLRQNLQDILTNNETYAKDICALGIVVDADNNLPSVVSKKYANALCAFFPAISDLPGVVTSGSPRTGIYVWPDNQSSGTLETLLLECSLSLYPDHQTGAASFLAGLDQGHKAHWKGSEPEKALMATIVSVLQPGQANYASFSKLSDKWISQATLDNVPGMQKLWSFIHELLP